MATKKADDSLFSELHSLVKNALEDALKDVQYPCFDHALRGAWLRVIVMEYHLVGGGGVCVFGCVRRVN